MKPSIAPKEEEEVLPVFDRGEPDRERSHAEQGTAQGKTDPAPAAEPLPGLSQNGRQDLFTRPPFHTSLLQQPFYRFNRP